MIFTRARKGLLNDNDLAILNSKVLVIIPIFNPDEQVVIVQQNASWHTINWIQIKRFAKDNNHNIIFFLVEHLRTKKTAAKLLIIRTC